MAFNEFRCGAALALLTLLSGLASSIFIPLAGGTHGLGWVVGYVLLYGAAYGAISPLQATASGSHG